MLYFLILFFRTIDTNSHHVYIHYFVIYFPRLNGFTKIIVHTGLNRTWLDVRIVYPANRIKIYKTEFDSTFDATGVIGTQRISSCKTFLSTQIQIPIRDTKHHVHFTRNAICRWKYSNLHCVMTVKALTCSENLRWNMLVTTPTIGVTWPDNCLTADQHKTH